MVSHKTQSVSKADIFLTCTEEQYYNSDLIVQKNTLIRMLSGVMKIVLPDVTLVVEAGDTIFLPRLELAKVEKKPKDGEPYKSVAINFSQEAVQQYLVKRHMKNMQPEIKSGIKLMEKHPLLDSLFGSLLPYFELKSELPEDIADAKVDEAISILKIIDENLFNTLGNFEEPGKINLTEFMEKNFMFNMTMDKFGYLTGRSITTFKRDFKKAFYTTPQKWLTQKRLALAHSQLAENNRRPVDVYMEAGFENLSHFSYVFKKQYGYSPTQVMNERHHV